MGFSCALGHSLRPFRILHDPAVGALKSMMTRMCKNQADTLPPLEHAFELHWNEIVIETEEHEEGYRVQKTLGSGGFGVVFAGHFRAEPRAIKVLGLDTPSAKRDFLAECGMLSRLHHPNICNFYGAAIHPKGTSGRLVIERLHCSLAAAVHNAASVGRAPLTDIERLRLTSEVSKKGKREGWARAVSNQWFGMWLTWGKNTLLTESHFAAPSPSLNKKLSGYGTCLVCYYRAKM